MGKINVKKLIKTAEMPKAEAAKILKKLDPTKYADNVEAYKKWAENMKPAVKKQYEQALDVTFGDKNKRALDTQNMDRKQLIKLEKEMNKKSKGYKFEDVDDFEQIDEAERLKNIEDNDGYDATASPIGNRINAYNKKGEKVGTSAYTKSEYNDGKAITPNDGYYNSRQEDLDANWTYVRPEDRGKAIASKMYRTAEEKSGLPYHPSNEQTAAGEGLWDVGAKAPPKSLQYDIEDSNARVRGFNERIKSTEAALERRQKEIDTKSWPEGLTEKDQLDTIARHKKELNNIQNKLKTEAEKLTKFNEQAKGDYSQINRPFGNTRHSDAAFDPRTKNSPYVKAAIAGAAVGAASLAGNNDAEASVPKDNKVPSSNEVLQQALKGENPELQSIISAQMEKAKNTDAGKYIAEKLRKTDEPSVLHDVVVPTVSDTLNLLNAPQRGLQALANFGTGNDVMEPSFTPALRSILQKLPQPIQPNEQDIENMGTGLDMILDPTEGLGKVGAVMGSIKTEKMPITLGHIEQRLNNVNSASRPMNVGKTAATVLGEAPNSFFGKTAVTDSTMPQQNFGKVNVVSNQREIDAAEKMKETGRKLALKEAERQAAKYGDKVNQSVMKLPQQ